MNRVFLKHSFPLLNIDYVRLDKHWNYRNVISPYYRLYLIDEGEGYISDEHGKLLLEAGNLYIIPSFTLCNLGCTDHLGQYFIHFFEETPDGISLFHQNRAVMRVAGNELDMELVKRALKINPGRGINRSDNPKVYEKNAFYLEYQALNNRQSDATYMETQGIIWQLISRFIGSADFKNKAQNSIPSKIIDAISYTQLNLQNDITVAQLASRANQNPDYFSRLFQDSTGMRPLAYLHLKRIERAQYLMASTAMSLAGIAEKTGFESQAYFARIFRKITYLSPGEYKQQNLLV